MRLSKAGVGLFVSALLSAAYWLDVLALLEGATSFDYSGGAEPDDGLIMLKVGAVLIYGMLLYAVLLIVPKRVAGLRVALGALAFAIVAGLYWTAIAFFLLAATAGDTRDGISPDRGMQRVVLILTLVVTPVIFALMLRWWHSVEGPRVGER